MGRLSMTDDRLLISAELVDGEKNQLIWGHTFRGKSEQILELQEEMARAVIGRLQLELGQAPEYSFERYQTDKVEVYHYYLKGRYHWGKTSPEGCRKAIDLFNKAIELQPDYALAYSGLADAYSTMGFYNFMEPKLALAQAKEAALKALELDPSLAEAHTSLAGVILIHEWNWLDSQKHFEMALRLNPNYCTTYHWLGIFDLTPRRQFQDAINALQHAQRLAPDSLRVNTGLGFVQYYAGRLDDAIAQFHFTLELNPEYVPAIYFLSLAYAENGDIQEAFKYMREAVERSEGAGYTLGGLAYLEAVGGDKRKSIELLDRLISERSENGLSPYDLAVLCAAVGRTDEVFKWLAVAWDARDNGLLYIDVDPRLKNVKNDPRLEEYRQQILGTSS
jgi:tetratricopeptide (TPR) repeat protein